MELERVCFIKYLGIYLDQHLRFDKQINFLNSKIARFSGLFYKLRNLLDLKTLIQIYYSLVYPHLIYGILSWGTASTTILKRLQIIQNKIIKIINFKSPYDHVSPLYKQLSILNIDKIFTFNCLKLMYKCKHSLVPNSISSLFTQPVHPYMTRFSEGNFSLQIIHTNYGKYSPSYACKYLWSALPDELKDLPFAQFRRAIMEIINYR